MSKPKPEPKKPRRQGNKKVKPVVSLVSLRQERTGRSTVKKTSETRRKFIEAFEVTCGNISASCDFAGIRRPTYYRWMNSPALINVKFQKRLAAIKPGDAIVDLSEGTMIGAIKRGDTVAAKFMLESHGKHRGYATGPQAVLVKSELETMLTAIRAMVDKKAKVNRISYIEQLRIYLELIGDQLKPEVRERLQKEVGE